MSKIAEFVCKHKTMVLIIGLLLLIPSIIGMRATRINYDILVYLPEDIETIQGENILSDEFSMGGFSIIVLDDNMPSKDIAKLEKEIKKLDNVEKVISATDLLGTRIPIEVVPSEIKDKVYKDGSTLMLVTFKDAISSDNTMNTIQELRKIADSRCKISGMTAALIDTKDLSDSEIAIYVLIAVGLCLVILQVALDSFISPVLLLLNIGIAILYNMGTNVFLGEISYITKAISAVLQLGVTMDFAIFLYHSYIAEKGNAKSKEEAMATAIQKTFTSVLGSSLTTIAGFLALCSMSLTLGKDIGIVMAKGVLFGIITVVTILPALILQFDGLIEKTKHKVILPKFSSLRDFIIKYHKIAIVLFILIMPFAFYCQNNTKVYYKLDSSLPDYLPSITANNELRDKFGLTSEAMIIVDKNLDDHKINEMTNEIEKIEGIDFTLSYSKVGTTIPEEILSDDIKSIFESEHYKMILVSSKYEIASDELNNQIGEINKVVKKYDEKGMFVGEGPLMKDLVEISNHDFNSVNTVSIGVIFVIMIFVLSSISLPVILILVIECAIFINMGIPYLTGTTIPFIASIVIGTIQLGATIDYAILITTKYIGNRKDGKDKKQAITDALGESISSIIVSGLCFFGATFGVGVYSKIELIGSLCTLMARGALISVAIVITMLPAFLMLFDKLICKTTKKMNTIKN